MLKKHKGLMILTSIIILLPMLAGVLLWDQLPEQVATHWGFRGEADGWSSRPMAVFGMPLVLLAIHWVGLWFTEQDRRNHGANAKMKMLMLWLLPAVSLFGSGSIYASAMGQKMQVDRLAFLFMGLLFTILGNYLPKCRQNYTIGIKIVWTLSSEENWNATHRLAGKLWMVGGLLMLLCGFLPVAWTVWMLPLILGIMVVIPMVYSWWFARNQKG